MAITPNRHAVAIGIAVRAAIVEAGLTQAQFAEKSGMALNTLSRRINGVLPFTWPEIAKVSDITGVAISELVASAERIANRDAA